MYTEAPYCDTANRWRSIFVARRIVFNFIGGRQGITHSCEARQRARRKLHAVLRIYRIDVRWPISLPHQMSALPLKVVALLTPAPTGWRFLTQRLVLVR